VQANLIFTVLSITGVGSAHRGDRLPGFHSITGPQFTADRFKGNKITRDSSKREHTAFDNLANKPDCGVGGCQNTLALENSIIDAPMASRIVAIWLKIGVDEVNRGSQWNLPGFLVRAVLGCFAAESRARAGLLLPKGKAEHGYGHCPGEDDSSQWVHSLRLPETRARGLIRGKSVDNFSGQRLKGAVMLMSSGIR